MSSSFTGAISFALGCKRLRTRLSSPAWAYLPLCPSVFLPNHSDQLCSIVVIARLEQLSHLRSLLIEADQDYLVRRDHDRRGRTTSTGSVRCGIEGR